MQPTRKQLLIAVLLAGELVSAVLAWRDLSRRSDEQVRGKKKMWRLLIVINPGNSLAYWFLGRRRVVPGLGGQDR